MTFKKIIRTLAFTLLFFLLAGFSTLQAEILFPVQKDRKWGLIDATGRIAIDPDLG